MNTTISNPVASVAAMNRPVTSRDIAAALHLNPSTVKVYLMGNNSGGTAQRVMEYAKKVGYDPKKAAEYGRTHQRAKKVKVESYYHNGNYHTKEAEIARMRELREQGYSNREIAQKLGRNVTMVYDNIGAQDPELSKQNRAMAQRIRAQKNAARKQYVTNKPIIEYNKRVDEHNRIKAELAQLQMELLTQKPAIVQAAQTKIDFPLIDLHTVQPTALQ